jgi:hypothetical protein
MKNFLELVFQSPGPVAMPLRLLIKGQKLNIYADDVSGREAAFLMPKIALL